ncbi:DUF4215 domain-containing protein [Candidatus Woesearchaeota archaeon]|nr:DUF4215 domain-containing protein [Candidatus Woesearchaeota archaeon]
MKKLSVLFVILIMVISLFALTSVLADQDESSSSDGGGDSSGSSSGGSSSSGKSSGGSSDSSKSSSSDSKSKSSSNSKESSSDDTSSSNIIGQAISKGDDKTETNDNDKFESKTEIKGDDQSESKDDDKEKTTTTIIDDDGNKVEIKTETKVEDGKTKIEEKRTFIDENGNKVEVKTKSETKDGETKTVVEREVINQNGVKITIKTKTKLKDGKEEVKLSIKVKGVEVTTKLSVKEKTQNGETSLVAKLSTGADQNILVLPDEALLKAFEELQATNQFTFELKEVGEGEKTKAVFSATATQSGKLFGIFNTNVNLETLIDTTTGEIIETQRPWWAFLVVGEYKSTVCHVKDSIHVVSQSVLITDVKSHLSHGDNIGECSASCGDGVIVGGIESCEIGDSKTCTTADGYAGSEGCTSTCDAFDSCASIESCGDNVVNGFEKCDDGNLLANDGCSASCQVEIISPPITTPVVNATV